MKKIFTLICFAIAANAFAQIPNASFENWGSRSAESLDKWLLQGNTAKSSSPHGGSFALRLMDESAAALYIDAYVGRPDTLSIWAKGYNEAGDSASIFIALQQLGNAFGFASLNIVLSDSNNYTEFRMPITYFFPLVKSDTITIGFQNSQGNVADTAFATIDDVRLTKAGATEGTLQNSGFETWNTNNIPTLSNWITSNDIATLFGVQSIMASQSSDAKSGNSAILLENKYIGAFQSVFPGAAISIDLARIDDALSNPDLPSFPVSKRWQYLHGYFKYIPVGADTANLRILMFKSGVQIGEGKWMTSATNTAYKMFSIYIGYTTADIPDSANINISAGSEDGDPQAGTKMLLDSLSFGYALSINTFDLGTVNIYPNPAKEQASLEFNMQNAAKATIVLTDIAGNQILSNNLTLQTGYNRMDLKTEHLSAGIYLIRINAGDQSLVKKLIVE